MLHMYSIIEFEYLAEFLRLSNILETFLIGFAFARSSSWSLLPKAFQPLNNILFVFHLQSTVSSVTYQKTPKLTYIVVDFIVELSKSNISFL